MMSSSIPAPCLLRTTLVLAFLVLPARADLHWIGTANGGNGTDFFQEANWDADGNPDPPHTSPDAGTLEHALSINDDVFIATGSIQVYGTIQLGTGSLSQSGGALISFGTFGIRADATAGGTQRPLSLSGTADLTTQFFADLDATISGAATLTLNGGGNPLNNTVVDLDPGWTGSITFTDETTADVLAEHIGKFEVGGAAVVLGSDPAEVEAGDNALLVSDGGSGAILTGTVTPAVVNTPGLNSYSVDDKPSYVPSWSAASSVVHGSPMNYTLYRDGILTYFGPATASNLLEILEPNTTYTFRVDAHFSGGVVARGPDLVFVSHASRVVDSSADPGTAGNGQTTLRQAITDVPTGETITFDPSLSGATITLTSGQLLIDKDLTVDASNLPAGITIDADGPVTSHRVMEVDTGVTVTLDSLTMTNGREPGSYVDGGGIRSDGFLTLVRSTVRDSACTNGGDGGGIAALSGGTLTLDRSSVLNCTARRGGGIFNWGPTVALDQSTISGNQAVGGNAGGIGGGGTRTISQSTISGNSASANGGGFAGSGDISLHNSIVAGNTAGGSGADIDKIAAGTVTREGANLIGDNATVEIEFPGGTPNGNDDLVGTSGSLLDPQLAPLDDYGGPTQTRPPLRDSPAIDAGPTTDPGGSDQRGSDRFVNGALDVGAVEIDPALDHAAVATFPASGATGIDFDPTVIWDAPSLGTPTQYQVFLNAGLHTTTTDTSLILPGLAANTTYTLRIDADYAGTSVPGPEITFTTRASTVVDTTVDPGVAGDGSTTLRQAIADAIPGETITFDPAVFNGEPADTITLASGQLVIAKNLTVDASENPGGVTINANGDVTNHRVLSIPSGGHTVTLDSLTLTGGRTPDNPGGSADGGGIYNDGGSLTLTNVTLSGNTTGGGVGFGGDGGSIYNLGGTLTLNQSTVSGNTTGDGGFGGGDGGDGGGIYNLGGTLTLNQSTVSGNTTGIGGGGGDGGGLYSSGNNSTLTLNQSTVSGNTTGDGGIGGGGDGGDGGGIYSLGGTLTLNQSTVSGNTTGNTTGGLGGDGGGIYSASLINDLNQVTIANNQTGGPFASGGGLVISNGLATATLTNSLIAGNTATATEPDLSIVGSATFNTAGANLVSDATGFTVDNGDPPLVGAPLLAPLGDYGGPTETMAPLPGSPAIDAAGTSDPGGTDQRGAPRFSNGALDIGAVETLSSPLVDLATDSSNGDPSPGDLTLREAILFAAPGETITFDTAVFNGEPADTIMLASGQLVIAKDLTIDASANPGGVTIDANGGVTNHRVLQIPSGGHTVTLDSLTLTGGRTPDNPGGSADGGGGIFNDGGTLILNQSTVSGNTTGGFGDGGGIYNLVGTLTLNQSTVSGNTTGTGGDGGGIYNLVGTLTLNQSTVSGNTTGTGGYGGGLYSSGTNATLTLNQSTVSGNTTGDGDGSGGFGGGLYSSGTNATLTLNQSTVSGNTTGDGGFGGIGGFGGGLFSSGTNATLTLNQSTVSGNTTGDGDGSGGPGGGLYSSGTNSTLTLDQSTVSGNTTGDGDSGGDGGGILSISPTNAFNQVTIANNQTGGPFASGGGLMISNGLATLTLTNSLIAGNTTTGTVPDLSVVGSATFNTAGANLVSDATGFTVDSGHAPLVGAPLLAPLGDYGGLTATHLLLPGSPAIEPLGGDNSSTFTTDQRGAPRITGSLVDIGSLEAVALSTLGLASTDGDSIPDILEGPGGPYPHLDPGVDDSSVDTDADGSTDAEEIANMTHLYDANDYFRILSFTKAAGFTPGNPVFDVTISSFPGLNYSFERLPDLGAPVPLGPPETADDFTTVVEVLLGTGKDFVRARRE